MAADPQGAIIRRARKHLRMTQQQLADKVGVSRNTVDSWENGRSKPTRYDVALEEVLGVSLDGAPVRSDPEVMGLAAKIREQLDELPPDVRDETTRAVASVLGVDQD